MLARPVRRQVRGAAQSHVASNERLAQQLRHNIPEHSTVVGDRYLHNISISEDATTATRSLARLPPLGLLRPRFPPGPRVGHGRHVTVGDQAFRAPLRAHRALRGGKRLAQSCVRLLLPFVAVDGEVATALHANLRASALAIKAGFLCHLGPNHLPSLRPADLVPPQACVDPTLRHWGLLLCLTERDVPSKTLPFDESMMLDSSWMCCAAPWIAALRLRPQGQPQNGPSTERRTRVYPTPLRDEPTSRFFYPGSRAIHCATAERHTTPGHDRSPLALRAQIA